MFCVVVTTSHGWLLSTSNVISVAGKADSLFNVILTTGFSPTASPVAHLSVPCWASLQNRWLCQQTGAWASEFGETNQGRGGMKKIVLFTHLCVLRMPIESTALKKEKAYGSGTGSFLCS